MVPTGLLGELNSHQFNESAIITSSRKYVYSMRSGRIIASIAMALMILLPGCLEEVTSSDTYSQISTNLEVNNSPIDLEFVGFF